MEITAAALRVARAELEAAEPAARRAIAAKVEQIEDALFRKMAMAVIKSQQRALIRDLSKRHP